ncbi:hypothetical protein Q8F55_001032 [Vanrija albida]|uniref:Palmitoyltransferase n=1 Tax=Vanrija albida TaxID=181172 RepID=A0ABR3QF45_9TREE
MDLPIQAHHSHSHTDTRPPPHHAPTSLSTSETHLTPHSHSQPSTAASTPSSTYHHHQRPVIPWWKPWEKLQTPAVPDPWIFRKQVVGIVLGLSAWAFYVGVARVCAPAIRKWPNAGFSRAAGIGTLVAFVILWLMFMWSYVVILTTPPGFANDVVPANPDPEAVQPPPSSVDVRSMTSSLIPSVERPPKAFEMSSMGPSPSAPPHPVPPHAEYIPNLTPRPDADYIPNLTPRPEAPPNQMEIPKPEGYSQHPPVFVTFNLWSGLFCLYNTVLLIVHTCLTPKVDGQQVALIVVSGFLFLFTLAMLLPTHIVLILSGKSTIESFQESGQRQRENAALAEHFAGSCNIRERRAVLKQWESEWGGVNATDRWVFGTKSELWEREMGDKWIGWILPLGKPQGDGVHFQANPRFGPNGEWLPKRYWPKGVAV